MSVAEYREIKKRLWNPPGARHSSELDITLSGSIEKSRTAVIEDLKNEIRKRDISIAALQGQMATLTQEVDRYRSLRGGYRPASVELIDGSPVTLKKITEAVSLRFHISIASILSRKQLQLCARPRLVLYYLAAELTEQSIAESARKLGRDHTTLLAGIRKVSRLVESGDEELKTHIAVVKQMLGVE